MLFRRPFTVACLSLALLGAACGGGGDDSDEGAAGEEQAGEVEGGEIDVWIMEPGAPELKDFFTGATDEFEAANPGTTVNVIFKPWASAHDQFTTAIGGGNVPDVAEMGSTWTPEFASVGALAGAEGNLSGYVESLVEGATFDGDAYGIPWYAGARSLIYRADVFTELGLTPPKTWDDLLAVGRTIRDKKPGMAAFSVAGNANHYFLPMVWQNGGEIATQKDGRWTSAMASPEAIEAIDFYANLFKKEKFAPAGAVAWNARDVRAAFEAGNLAMMIGGGWDVAAMVAAHPDLDGKIATALLPAGPSGSQDTFAGGSHLVVFEDSDHVALARRYVDFLLEPERVNAFTAKIGFLPGGLDALAATGGDERSATFTTQLKDHSRTYPPSVKWGGFEADALFVNAVQSVMKGDKTAKDAMAEVAEAMNAAFAEE
jgi:N,N'-diacetylchitobiose transport system substrate-binding protein